MRLHVANRRIQLHRSVAAVSIIATESNKLKSSVLPTSEVLYATVNTKLPTHAVRTGPKTMTGLKAIDESNVDQAMIRFINAA